MSRRARGRPVWPRLEQEGWGFTDKTYACATHCAVVGCGLREWQVKAAVGALYGVGDQQSKSRADGWLRSFQKSVQAWQIADHLLTKCTMQEQKASTRRMGRSSRQDRESPPRAPVACGVEAEQGCECIRTQRTQITGVSHEPRPCSSPHTRCTSRSSSTTTACRPVPASRCGSRCSGTACATGQVREARQGAGVREARRAARSHLSAGLPATRAGGCAEEAVPGRGSAGVAGPELAQHRHGGSARQAAGAWPKLQSQRRISDPLCRPHRGSGSHRRQPC